MTKRKLRIAGPMLALLLLAAACGDDDKTDTASSGTGSGSSAYTFPDSVPEDLTGSIAIEGSSTVFPITDAVQLAFTEEREVDVTVGGEGTTVGMESFCKGELEIADASREIKDEEKTACTDAGVDYVQLEIAIDGLSVMASPDSTLECLTMKDLYAITSAEAQTKKASADAKPAWAEVAKFAQELGSTTKFPTGELALTGPGKESGTYGSWADLVVKPIGEERVDSAGLSEDLEDAIRDDYPASADDNVIVDNIGASETSIGWVGFSYADQAAQAGDVKILEVDGGKGCVAPTKETIEDGTYPLSRSLYLYVNKKKIAENEALGPFVDFYLANLAIAVDEADYINLPDDREQATTDAWEQASA